MYITVYDRVCRASGCPTRRGRFGVLVSLGHWHWQWRADLPAALLVQPGDLPHSPGDLANVGPTLRGVV